MFTTLTLLLAATTAQAAPPFTPPFTDGEAIYAPDARYDATTQTITAGATVQGIGPAALGNFVATINGVATTISATPTGSAMTADIPLGPSYLGTPNPWPTAAPYRRILAEQVFVPKPVVFEIRRATGQKVLFRQRSTIYDLREDEATLPWFTDTDAERAMVSQLTPQGLSALAPVHQDDLPHPDPTTFDAQLDALAAVVPVETSTPARLCRPLDELVAEDARWETLQAVQTIKTEAEISWGAWVTASNAGVPGAALMCVQGVLPPSNADFEVCVQRLETELTSVDIADVAGVSLAFDNAVSGRIRSDLFLDQPHADLDVRLRDLEVRLIPSVPGCLPPIDRDLDNATEIADADLLRTPWLLAWSECHDVSLDDATALPSTWIEHDTAPDATLQLLDVTDASSTSFDLPAPTIDTNVGTCGQPWIQPSVDALVELFEDDVEGVLDDAWDDGAPRGQGEALADLLEPFELSRFVVPGTDDPADIVPWVSQTSTGLWATWRTHTVPSDPVVANLAPAPWLFRDPELRSWILNTDNLDPAGDPFHLAFAVSTTHLNQHLRARAAVDGPQGRFAPTWADLGLTPPGGQTPDDPATLDGNTLQNWFPAFAPLGNRTVTIDIEAPLPPMVFMDPDPAPGVAFGDTAVRFYWPDVRVTIATDQATPFLITTVHVDLFDEDLVFDLPTDYASRAVDITIDDPEWMALATVTPPNCPMYPILEIPQNQNRCDDQLAEAVRSMVERHLLESARRALSDVTVTSWFDPEGPGTTRRRLQQVREVRDGMYVAWFGLLQ